MPPKGTGCGNRPKLEREKRKEKNEDGENEKLEIERAKDG